ncbi:virion core protein [Bovine papular stomatitis virus]
MDLRKRFAQDLAKTSLVLAEYNSMLFTKCPQAPAPATQPTCPAEEEVDSMEKYTVKEMGKYFQQRLKSTTDCLARPSDRNPLAPPCSAPRTPVSCAPPAVCPAPEAPVCPAQAQTCPPAPPLPARPVPAARPSLGQQAPPPYPADNCPTLAVAKAAEQSPVLETRLPDKITDSVSDRVNIKRELENIAESVRDLSAESSNLTNDIEQAKNATQTAIDDLRRLLSRSMDSGNATSAVDRVDNASSS